jgi:hypothetical protein
MLTRSLKRWTRYIKEIIKVHDYQKKGLNNKMKNTQGNGDEDSIGLANKEKSYTEGMRKYTYFIENLIENEENNLTRLLDEFKHIYAWVKKETAKSKTNQLKDAAIKQQILEKCTQLRTDAEKNLRLLDAISKSTENERLTDDTKAQIKIRMRRTYENQKDLDKIVHYPRDIASLIKDVISNIQKGENLAEKDMDVENKTKELVKNFIELIKSVHEELDKIIESITKGSDISSILDEMEDIKKKVDQEVRTFSSLDKLERLHLQVLLEIFKDEEKTLEEEKRLNKAQSEFDQEEGYQTDQDGTIIFRQY